MRKATRQLIVAIAILFFAICLIVAASASEAPTSTVPEATQTPVPEATATPEIAPEPTPTPEPVTEAPEPLPAHGDHWSELQQTADYAFQLEAALFEANDRLEAAGLEPVPMPEVGE